jgi:hypothetical protein
MSVAMAQPILLVEVLCQSLQVVFRAQDDVRALLGVEQALPIIDPSNGRTREAEQSLPAQRKLDRAAIDVPFPDAVVCALDRQCIAILPLAHTLLERLTASLLVRQFRLIVPHPIPQSIDPRSQFAQRSCRGIDGSDREAVLDQVMRCLDESAQRAQNEHLHVDCRDAERQCQQAE